MIVNEISIWGAALVAILVVIAMIALAFVDSKMLRRMLVIFAATLAQMAVVGAVVLLAFKTFAWWAYLLWYLLILFLLIGASFVANVLAGVIALSMIHKGTRKA